MPNLAGKYIPKIAINQSNQKISVQETTFWRDCWMSSYIPRVGIGQQLNDNENIEAPPINALGLRGFVAIWNDGLRNKEYEEERMEYLGDTVGDNEFKNIFGRVRKMRTFTQQEQEEITATIQTIEQA